MPLTPRTSLQNADDLPHELLEMSEMIASLPASYRSRLGPALERVVDTTRRRRRILTLVQEALGQLRLDMKYLMFDLEATRRERDDLRRRPGD